jgi:8-oxo-dGTP diphosphatase
MATREGRRKYVYDYPRPMVTVDLVVLTPRDDRLLVLLIRRGHEPFKNRWALPGGFVEIDEPLEDAARRELAEETGLSLPRLRRRSGNVHMEELRSFGQPGRDPRGRTITIAYLVLIRPGHAPTLRAGDDATEAEWFNMYRLPKLAFDHRDIIRCAVERLRTDFEHRHLALWLLPRSPSVDQVQRIYEAVFHRSFDRQAIRRRASQLGIRVGRTLDKWAPGQ